MTGAGPLEDPVYGERWISFTRLNTQVSNGSFFSIRILRWLRLCRASPHCSTGYDLVATHAPIRFKFPEMESSFGPLSFPQFNSGVIGMRRNPAFIDAWIESYETIKTIFPQIYPGQSFNKDDQTAFRKALLGLPRTFFFRLARRIQCQTFWRVFFGATLRRS